MVTDEMRDLINRRGDRRLYAYYFGFKPTGDERIDFLLAAVAAAGHAYHSTEWWNDDDEGHGFSYVDIIQAAANEAAETR